MATLGRASSEKCNQCGVPLQVGSVTSEYIRSVVLGVHGGWWGVVCVIGDPTLGGVSCSTWV